MKKITFLIPTRNNLEFLKIAYLNLKKLSNGFHKILILDDASVDGTKEWLSTLHDPNLKTYINTNTERIGIVGLINKGVDLVDTEIMMVFHSDMVPSSNLDLNILKHLKPQTIVSATRAEPALNPAGSEKISIDFGSEVDNFRLNDWNNWSGENEILNKDKTTEGISSPFCMYKKDFTSIGGYDPLFTPQCKEDSDLFNRFVLNGYNIIQSWDALVYHFVGRGSRFNKFSGGSTGTNSSEWINTDNKNLKNFIRKWGSFVKNDPMMKPIITPKFDLGFRVKNIDVQKLAILEPLCSNIGIENRFEIQNEYIKVEQLHTPFSLSNKIKDYEPNGFNPLTNDIIIEFDVNRMNEQSFNMLLQLPNIIDQSGTKGEFELDIFKIIVNKMNRLENSLIKVTK